MTRALLTATFLLLFPAAQSNYPTLDTPLALRILPLAQFAPGAVSYRIRIDPHRDNFWFCMGWHSSTAAVTNRTSCQQLNGIYSPRVVYQEYRALTPGTYYGFVDLYRTPNYRAHTATQSFRVESVH